jgi:diazepam-binding inhibitor (GABA receptor modulating acyl-CoA-binding protein)
MDNTLKAQFEAAQTKAKTATQRPDNETLLKLYAYFKQATAGDAGPDRPGAFDFVGRAKYDAWVELKGTTAEEAMRGYIFVVAGMDFD